MSEPYIFIPYPIRVIDQRNRLDITFEGRTNRRIMETADDAGLDCAVGHPIGILVSGTAFINGHTYSPGDLLPLAQAYPASPLIINLIPLPPFCAWDD